MGQRGDDPRGGADRADPLYQAFDRLNAIKREHMAEGQITADEAGLLPALATAVGGIPAGGQGLENLGVEIAHQLLDQRAGERDGKPYGTVGELERGMGGLWADGFLTGMVYERIRADDGGLADRALAACERIAYHEVQDDPVAEQMRQLAREVVHSGQ